MPGSLLNFTAKMNHVLKAGLVNSNSEGHQLKISNHKLPLLPPFLLLLKWQFSYNLLNKFPVDFQLSAQIDTSEMLSG